MSDAGIDAGDGGLRGTICGDRTGLEEAAGWPSLAGCSKRASYLETSGPLSPQSFDVATTSAIAPVVRKDGAVAFVSGSTLVFEVGGKITERLDVGRTITAPPVLLEDSRALLVLEARTVALFDRRKAAGDDAGVTIVAPEWELDAAQGVGGSFSSITFSKNVLYFTGKGKLHALPLRATAIAWSLDLGGESEIAPAVDGAGKIVAVARTGRVTFANAAGESSAAFELGAAVRAFPAIAKDDVVCLGDESGHLRFFTEKSTLANIDVGGPVTTACALDGFGFAFVGVSERLVAASRTGITTFSYATRGVIAPPVLGSNRVVYFGSSDATVYAVGMDGLLVWAANVRAPVELSPAIGPGRALHVITSRGLTTIGP